MSKLVSIVLPVYNGERYLRESIDSILEQTYKNWELLILDDCSDDDTSNIAQAYAVRDPRIHYYRNEYNLQLPGNLNKGFSLSKGDYLTWTSDDNRYKPEAISKMVDILNKYPEVNFVFASCRIIDAEGKEVEFITVNNNSPKWIVGMNSVGACFMYTRNVYETIGEYDTELKLVEDFDYWQRICSKFQSKGINEILYEYRWHDGALTSTMKKEIFNNNLEKMLLKNRPLFGKLSIHQRYLFYRSLYNCRPQKLNLYFLKYKLSCIANFWCFRMPNKVIRTIRGQ